MDRSRRWRPLTGGASAFVPNQADLLAEQVLPALLGNKVERRLKLRKALACLVPAHDDLGRAEPDRLAVGVQAARSERGRRMVKCSERSIPLKERANATQPWRRPLREEKRGRAPGGGGAGGIVATASPQWQSAAHRSPRTRVPGLSLSSHLARPKSSSPKLPALIRAVPEPRALRKGSGAPAPAPLAGAAAAAEAPEAMGGDAWNASKRSACRNRLPRRESALRARVRARGRCLAVKALSSAPSGRRGTLWPRHRAVPCHHGCVARGVWQG